MPATVLTDILSEKIKRETSDQYKQFIDYVNELAKGCDTVEALQQAAQPLEKFMPNLDSELSVTDDYEDIMNMKATLLDVFVNDCNHQSIYLLAHALSSNPAHTHLQTFIAPIQYWVVVIKAKELLQA